MITRGVQDAILTQNPQVTFFKLVYKQHTNFAIQQNIKNLGLKNFNTNGSYKITNTGDLLQSLHLILTIPKIELYNSSVSYNISNSYYNINELCILYNNVNSYIFNYDNYYWIIPQYIFKLFNYNSKISYLNNLDIISKLIPSIITIKDLPNSFKLLDINETYLNSIINLLRKEDTFFEDYLLNHIKSSSSFVYSNQLITQFSYIEYLYNQVNDLFYTNYNTQHNLRKNKEYYEFGDEVKQYLDYKQNNPSIRYGFDCDIVYNYCIDNKISNYKLYQTNCLYYNPIFIYNLLLQLYPSKFNTFTFWKKYVLLSANEPNINYTVNSTNSFSEFESNLNSHWDSILLNNNLQIFEIYKSKYSQVQNKINQMFNLLEIKNPKNLFIVLSTFINFYDNTTKLINFDDYNSNTNTNLLNNKINEQVDSYSNLIRLNSDILSSSSITKNRTIYPIDLMVLYPFIAYKLVEKIISLLYFDEYIFLIYWRNKINNYYFLNYKQFQTKNASNTDLYDSYDLERKLTFYANFDNYKLLTLSQIKKYFIDMFYSYSIFGSINMNAEQYNNFKLKINTIQQNNLTIDNNPIKLDENIIKTFVKTNINTKYTINNFTQSGTQVVINNWLNNYDENTKYFIDYNNIKYQVTSFTNNNFILTLNLNDIIIFNNLSFILEEYHILNIPLINFSINSNSNNINTLNIFLKEDNVITNDNLVSSNQTITINNLQFRISNQVTNFLNLNKILTVITTGATYRFNIEIENNNTYFSVITTENITFNKSDILQMNIEFLNIGIRDIGTKDSNTIQNNKFPIPVRNDWSYDPKNTYWLVYENTYYPLKYSIASDGEFIVIDDIPTNNYIIREINNSFTPNLYTYANHFNNTSKPSDLMDYFLQTPFILLSNNNLPYVYLYNAPFIINETTEILIDDFKLNSLFPLNSNQFFEKKISPTFCKENLSNRITFQTILSNMYTLFDSLYINNTQYSNIINVLETANNEFITLNSDLLSNVSYFGSTSQKIIKNINLSNFSNNDFLKYNKLCLDIYGNNNDLISNSQIQTLNVTIYTTPYVQYMGYRKISTDIETYLNQIPNFFLEQITWITENQDYLLITNKNQYDQNYSSLSDINYNIEKTFFNQSQYKYKTLFDIDTTNLKSIYSINNTSNNNTTNTSNNNTTNNNTTNNTNNKFNIDNYETSNTFYADFIDGIKNNDKKTDVDIVSYDGEKFNYFGPIFLDSSSNIILNSNVIISQYNYIKLDDNKIYPISETSQNSNIYNQVNKNSYGYNIVDTTTNIDFNKFDTLYYLKIKIDLSNSYIGDLGNCLYNNGLIYYFEVFDYDNNEIEILSKTKFDVTNTNYLIGFITINSINDLFDKNFNTTENFTYINLINIQIYEHFDFNYYNSITNITNNFIVNNTIEPIIKRISIFNFIYINSVLDIVTVNLKNYTVTKLQPFNFSSFQNITLSDNLLIKLDKYIIDDLTILNTLSSNNYDLFLLSNNNPNFISISISGTVTRVSNKIHIIFNSTDELIGYSYYKILDRYIYIDSTNLDNLDYIINDTNNLDYYILGDFTEIYLLDNKYFDSILPLVQDHKHISLKDNLLENRIYGQINELKPEYKIESLIYNSNLNIYSYDISSIKISQSDEFKVELCLDNFIRPVILKNKVDSEYPIFNFQYEKNNTLTTDSLIVLNNIPEINDTFVNLEIVFGLPITTIETLTPSLSIFSTNENLISSISLNSTTGIVNDKYYLFKLLVNSKYPVYFWLLITNKTINYTSSNISEPIYINETNKSLFSLNSNINYLGSLPNIITLNNHNLQISNIFYNYLDRIVGSQYYISNIYKDSQLLDIRTNNNPKAKKITPKLELVKQSDIISFDSNYIYLTPKISEIINNVSYLLVINYDKYFLINNIVILNNSLFIDGGLDTTKSINIYYSLYSLNYNFNNLVLYNNKIVKYDYTDLDINEIILIQNNLFIVLGLDAKTKYYDLKLLSDTTIISTNINGYYSIGNLDNTETFKIPKLEPEPFIFNLDSSLLSFGDYYIYNNELKIKQDNINYSDIFSFNKKGMKLNIIVSNSKFYYWDRFDVLDILDNLIYNNTIYKIKYIKDHQIFFFPNNLIQLQDGIYDFYYPYQPFENIWLEINNQSYITNTIIKDNTYVELDNQYFIIINNQIQNYSIVSGFNLLTRIYKFNNNKQYFSNELEIKTSNVPSINNVIKINCLVLDSTTIDLDNAIVLENYIFWKQPIKINSTINYIKSIKYRDTTSIVELIYPTELVGNVSVIFTPLCLYQYNYYSVLQLDNLMMPNILTEYQSYNIINDQLVNSYNTFNENYLNFSQNYVPYSDNHIEIDSYHLVLEVYNNDRFVHVVKITYPKKIKFLTQILSTNSDFYFDKIYPININWNFGFFYFLPFLFYKELQILDINANEIELWYEYSVKTIGTPIYNNNLFKIEIEAGNVFFKIPIYLEEKSNQSYLLVNENNKFYLTSSIYLGNNINKFYVKQKNWIESFQLKEKTWITTYNNHNDSSILDILSINNIYDEKIIIPVILNLEIVGETYKYSIYSLNNDPLILDTLYTYYIESPTLQIIETYIFENKSYIFTNTAIQNLKTQLFMYKQTNINYFNKLKLSKTIPEIISKIKIDSDIKPYMIFSDLKTWNYWSLLSFDFNSLLKKGAIIYNTVSTEEMYWTNEEYSYLTELLTFINTNEGEYEKLLVQKNIFNKLILHLDNWLNDYSFWLDPIKQINQFLIDFNFTNVTFNGSCLVFTNELNIQKRQYVLNNQYNLVSKTRIERNNSLINNEIANLITNANINSYYGIEINDLLYKLVTVSNSFIKVINDINYIDDNYQPYLNVTKLFINNIWINYSQIHKEINQNFNKILTIQNNITTKNTDRILNFTSDFKLIESPTPDESYIYTVTKFENNYYKTYIDNYDIISERKYPYEINLSTDTILPDKIYKINFYNQNIEQLIDYNSWSNLIQFYLDSDYNPNTNFSLEGVSSYNTTSINLGNLYYVQFDISNNINFNFDIVDSFDYSDKSLILYKSNTNSNINFNFISPIALQANQVVEFKYNIGIKNQSGNKLEFFQNNFNYIENQTFIKFNETYLILLYDNIDGYHLEREILLDENIKIINLININSAIDSGLKIIQLNLSEPFKYYNMYVNNKLNIIPTNFTLNNNTEEIIPLEIQINDETNFYVILNNFVNVKTINHYINIGETVPIQIKKIEKINKYLYNTSEYLQILDNSKLLLNDEVCQSITGNQFLINSLYSNDDLKNKSIKLENTWTISDYIYNPNTNDLEFKLEYLNNFEFKITNNYKYYINDISTNTIYVTNTMIKLNINNQNISSNIIFKQQYNSNTIVYKPTLNQQTKITLDYDYQFLNTPKLYINCDSNNKYLYKLQLANIIPDINNIQLNLVSSASTHLVKLFYVIDNYNIIIGSNELLNLSEIYKINNNINIINIEYKQENYQNGSFYFQDKLNEVNIFMNSSVLELDFSTQSINPRYYIASSNVNIKLNNKYNNYEFVQCDNLKIKVDKTTNIITNKIIPEFKSPFEWFKNITFKMGDQIIETLTPETFNIYYNLYQTKEKQLQLDKIIKIIETPTSWKTILPLNFWFNYNSTMALPLIALPYSEILLDYQLNSFDSIIKQPVKYNDKPQIKLELCIDSILLDTNERKLFGSSQHEYLIERFKIYSSSLIHKELQFVPIKFSNLIKDIIFISQPIYHKDDTSYKTIYYEQDEKASYYKVMLELYNTFVITNVYPDFSYSNDFAIMDKVSKELLLNNSTRITNIKSNKYLSLFDLKYELYLLEKYYNNNLVTLTIYFSKIYKNKEKYKETSPINNFTLKVNDKQLVGTSNYLNCCMYDKFQASPPTGYYAITFSLNPAQYQPSGHLNFNHLENVSIEIESNPNVLNEPYNLKIIVKEYQILRIMSGMGALSWI